MMINAPALVSPGTTPTTSSVDPSDGRTALIELAALARSAVQSARTAFVSRTAPSIAGSGSSAHYIQNFGQTTGSVLLVTSTARLGLVTAPMGAQASPARPELDRIELGCDSAIGVLDGFHARLVMSIQTSIVPRNGRIEIFRADLGPVPGLAKPGVSALTQMVPDRNTRKNIDPISISAFRSAGVGGGTRASDFVGPDPQIGSRVARSSGSTDLVGRPAATNALRPIGSGQLLTIANVDPSVLNPIMSARFPGVGVNSFFLTQRALNGPPSIPIPISTGRQSGINILRGGGISSGAVVGGSNSTGFVLVGTVPCAAGRLVGAFTEYAYTDPSIVYGRKYTYYISVVDSRGVRSLRSRMVTVDVAAVVPPPTPRVSYIVTPGLRYDPAPHPRFTLASTAQFIDHIEVHRRGGDTPESVVVLNTDGALVDTQPPTLGPTGFRHIGDFQLGFDGTTTIVDTDAGAGHDVDYRFYAVDSFGLKSQTPASCSLIIPENGGRFIPIQIPNVTAEQIPGGRAIRVTVASDDPRAVGAVVSRVISSQHERGFHSPNSPEKVRMGNGTSGLRGRSRMDPMLFGPAAWLGLLQFVSGTAQFLDQAIDFDRTYQYSVVAFGNSGQQSSPGFSVKVPARTRPIIDPPSDVRVNVLTSASIPTGVQVAWSGSTIDFTPTQLVGSQGDLADSAQRTVYQVERRPAGDRLGIWSAMPATTATFFVDPVSDGEPPPFRPSFAALLGEYDYRVIAMQSGGFISLYSDAVRVTVEPPAAPTEMLWARSTNLAVRPLAVVVSWPFDSGSIDLWHVERAEVNKIFGSQVTSIDSDAVRALPYLRVGEVTRESSRALQITADVLPSGTTIFVGNRYFIDGDIDPANSYFYRVRAVLPSGTPSEWRHVGINLNDSAHDRKFFSTISDQTKEMLASTNQAISTSGIE